MILDEFFFSHSLLDTLPTPKQIALSIICVDNDLRAVEAGVLEAPPSVTVAYLRREVWRLSTMLGTYALSGDKIKGALASMQTAGGMKPFVDQLARNFDGMCIVVVTGMEGSLLEGAIQLQVHTGVTPALSAALRLERGCNWDELAASLNDALQRATGRASAAAPTTRPPPPVPPQPVVPEPAPAPVPAPVPAPAPAPAPPKQQPAQKPPAPKKTPVPPKAAAESKSVEQERDDTAIQRLRARTNAPAEWFSRITLPAVSCSDGGSPFGKFGMSMQAGDLRMLNSTDFSAEYSTSLQRQEAWLKLGILRIAASNPRTLDTVMSHCPCSLEASYTRKPGDNMVVISPCTPLMALLFVVTASALSEYLDTSDVRWGMADISLSSCKEFRSYLHQHYGHIPVTGFRRTSKHHFRAWVPRSADDRAVLTESRIREGCTCFTVLESKTLINEKGPPDGRDPTTEPADSGRVMFILNQ